MELSDKIYKVGLALSLGAIGIGSLTLGYVRYRHRQEEQQQLSEEQKAAEMHFEKTQQYELKHPQERREYPTYPGCSGFVCLW